MKRFLTGFLLLLMTACAASTQSSESVMPKMEPASLPDLEPAPELTNTTWLNVDSPLRLADLRGKVVRCRQVRSLNPIANINQQQTLTTHIPISSHSLN